MSVAPLKPEIAECALPQWQPRWRICSHDGFPPAVAQWLDTQWLAYDAPSSALTPIVTLAFESTRSIRAAPANADQQFSKDVFGQIVQLRSGATTLHCEHGVSGCQVDLEADATVHIVAWGPDPRAPILAAFYEAFAARGWFKMHAGAFVWPNGDGGAECLVGLSGAGKSCGVQLAVQQGAAPLGEDLLWVQGETLLAVAATAKCRFKADAFKLLPWLDQSTARLEPDGKWSLDFAEVGATMAAPAIIQSIRYLPWHAPTNNRIAQLELLWRAFGIPVTGAGRRRLEATVAALLKR